ELKEMRENMVSTMRRVHSEYNTKINAKSSNKESDDDESDMYSCQCGREVTCVICMNVFCRKKGYSLCCHDSTCHGICPRCCNKGNVYNCNECDNYFGLGGARIN